MLKGGELYLGFFGEVLERAIFDQRRSAKTNELESE